MLMVGRTKKVMDANPELKQKWTSLTPTGRMGVPEDLMGAVVYLLSDASAFTTGAGEKPKALFEAHSD